MDTGWGLTVVLWLQAQRNPLWEPPLLLLHWLGGESAVLLLLPAVWWCWHPALGRRLTVGLLASFWLNAALKTALHLPRPFHVSAAVHELFVERGPGLPSGHTQSAALLATLLWLTWRRPEVAAGGLLLTGAMAFSRVAAGVHLPGDVLLGAALGVLLALLLDWAERRGGSRWEALPAPRRALLGTAAVGLALLLFPGLLTPPEQLRSAAPAALGTLWGVLLGRSAWPAAARCAWWWWPLGLLGALALRAGLSALLADCQPDLLWRFARYALLGAWLAAVPALAQRRRLAPPADTPAG
ncbi:MAG: phosphatase PAP2 family protein [Fimbriimonadaceae bacterium]|nr:phosphatase PAP2 family protein [Fimbriimonadaceae bacterium]